MKIGIVGVGVVGEAAKYGFEKIGHQLLCHDIRLQTCLEDVLNAEICFLCLPTPSGENGECDIKIVTKVIDDLHLLEYGGIIAIKSTVVPGTTQSLIQQYGNNKICFVPEFLRERCASVDFIENHDVCIIGTEDKEVYEKIVEAHGSLPETFQQLSPTEAELSKYFNNIYNATLITFANSFYEVCNSVGADYTKVKNAATLRKHIEDIYLDCNNNFRGFGGMCLPKDTKAINALCKRKKIDVEFFQHLLNENSKYEVTVYDGMREE
jgi:UDPglucose 6-dehydrogenase